MHALEAGKQRLRARVCVEGILTHLSQGRVIVHVLARSEKGAVQVMVPVKGHGVVRPAPAGTQQAQSLWIGWAGLPLRVEAMATRPFTEAHTGTCIVPETILVARPPSQLVHLLSAQEAKQFRRLFGEGERKSMWRQLERSIENVGTYLIHHPGTSAAIRAFSSSNLRVCPIRRPSMAINVYSRTHPPTHPSKDGTFSIFNVERTRRFPLIICITLCMACPLSACSNPLEVALL